jgi:hypothetical protein
MNLSEAALLNGGSGRQLKMPDRNPEPDIDFCHKITLLGLTAHLMTSSAPGPSGLSSLLSLTVNNQFSTLSFVLFYIFFL